MKKLFILIITVVVLFAGFVVYVNKDTIFNSGPIKSCEHVFKDGVCTECGELEDKENTFGKDWDNA